MQFVRQRLWTLGSITDARAGLVHRDSQREQLVALKDLAAVLRDRDINFCAYLLSLSCLRDAHLARCPPHIPGSFSSLPSTNSTAGSSPASTNAKLVQLQACEVHLVAKECELDARRVTIARDGLGALRRALIGLGEMGERALSASWSGPAPKPSSAILPRLSTNGNPTMYTSEDLSLTPSQIAAMSVEASHEGPTPRKTHMSCPRPYPNPKRK
ncbi:hypothetical protein OG21DRAFT_1491567 [Imleria badia]|nr:hypothetical protein OG21DRAFT_1491567 [Imleria badia]